MSYAHPHSARVQQPSSIAQDKSAFLIYCRGSRTSQRSLFFTPSSEWRLVMQFPRTAFDDMERICLPTERPANFYLVIDSDRDKPRHLMLVPCQYERQQRAYNAFNLSLIVIVSVRLLRDHIESQCAVDMQLRHLGTRRQLGIDATGSAGRGEIVLTFNNSLDLRLNKQHARRLRDFLIYRERVSP